jgi:hypothetical protein
MNITTNPQFKINQKVKIKSDVKQLRFGWGFFTKNSVGIVSAVHGGRIDVEFPEQHATFIADELEIVEDVETTVTISLQQFKMMFLLATMGYTELYANTQEELDKVNELFDSYEKKFGSEPLSKEGYDNFLSNLKELLNT